jgi:hypothetical protein
LPDPDVEGGAHHLGVVEPGDPGRHQVLDGVVVEAGADAVLVVLAQLLEASA